MVVLKSAGVRLIGWLDCGRGDEVESGEEEEVDGDDPGEEEAGAEEAGAEEPVAVEPVAEVPGVVAHAAVAARRAAASAAPPVRAAVRAPLLRAESCDGLDLFIRDLPVASRRRNGTPSRAGRRWGRKPWSGYGQAQAQEEPAGLFPSGLRVLAGSGPGCSLRPFQCL